MTQAFVDRIDATGATISISEQDAALRAGEPLHRAFRLGNPHLTGDYVDYMRRMAGEGAGLVQLIDEGEVCAIAVWRAYLTTYTGRRFEIDDLVTAEGQRSKGYGATLLRALEAKACALKCNAVMLTSATWRVDAHRFYLRERYTIGAFLFSKPLR